MASYYALAGLATGIALVVATLVASLVGRFGRPLTPDHRRLARSTACAAI